MMLLALAIAPMLLWDSGPSTASLLEKAGVHEIAVTGDPGQWTGTKIQARPVDPNRLIRLPAPGIDYQAARAGATSAPWVRSNLWQLIRQSSAAFLYDVTGPSVSLAIAEAGATGVESYFRLQEQDLETFQRGVAFLNSIDRRTLPVRANFGLVDDGTSLASEVMNLLVRRNLLFQPVKTADDFKGTVVKLGSPEYPVELAREPYKFSGVIRSKVTDDRRLVRVYGSDTAIARLYGDDRNSRLHLIQFGRNPIAGIRVRVLGHYPRVLIASLGSRMMPAEDIVVNDSATEFSIPELKSYAVVYLDGNKPGELISTYADKDFELTANPAAKEWQNAIPARITHDALGDALPFGATEVRSRWTYDALYLLYSCPYTGLNLKPSPETTKETPRLWTWDVAEAFIGIDNVNINRYREYQVSPQGEWVDLAIDVLASKPDGGLSWDSGMQVKARVDEAHKIWYGEMRIPLQSLADGEPAREFHGGDRLRVGLFRLAGSEPDRSLGAWQPTYRRSFHIPEAFGTLVLKGPR